MALVPPSTSFANQDQWRQWQQLVGLLEGQDEWYSPVTLNDSSGSQLFDARDGGVTIPTLSVTTLGVTTVNATTVNAVDLNVTGNTVLGNAAGDTITLTGTTTASGNITANGTFSTTSTTNLGDTSADVLTVAATTNINAQTSITADQGIRLRNSNTAGYWALNATNVADPVLEFKDASGDNMLVINPSASTYAIDVNNGTLATNSARFTGDVLITTDLGVRTVNATSNLNATANVTGAKIVAGGTTFSGSEKLRVVSGSSRLEGQVVVTTGGVDVTGSSTFNTATTFSSSIDVNGGALITNITVDGTGTPFTFTGTSQTSTTVGAAGGASALPANPVGYLKITVGATDYKVPYYNA